MVRLAWILIIATAFPAAAQERACFEVVPVTLGNVMEDHQAILIDRCTGRSWKYASWSSDISNKTAPLVSGWIPLARFDLPTGASDAATR